MKIGKLLNETLEKIILAHVTHRRSEVLAGPQVGEDCSVVDFGDNLLVISSDPITGATQNVGSLAVHIACNDIAANGVAPLGIMLTLLAPPAITEKELEEIIQDADRAAASIGVEILGGHTEITDAVNRTILSATALGRQPKNEIPLTGLTQPGDQVIMTKYAGLEGTAILAGEYRGALLKTLEPELLEKAVALGKEISVVKEGLLIGKLGVAGHMHDVTEGGIYGALWELAERAGLGIKVYPDRILMKEETKAICQVLGLDPYRLISSGVMILTVPAEKSEEVLAQLAEAAIPAAVVATMTAENRVILGEKTVPLDPPESDQLYQASSITCS